MNSVIGEIFANTNQGVEMSQIKIEEQIGGAIIRMNGQFIGGDETDRLRQTLKDLAKKENAAVILDMEKTSYLNSTALGVLISAHASFVKNNGKIVLCNVGKSIENIFVITKLTLVFPIYDTMEEAKSKISE